MTEKKAYRQPQLTSYGNVQDLTQQFNKVGTVNDVFTGTPCVEGEVTGSLIRVP